MNRHTPGNWYPYFDGEHWNVCLEGGEGFGREIVGCEGLYRCDGSDEANARLIAAAPELLEAIKILLDCVTDIRGIDIEDYCPKSLLLAREVIAKATGESA